MIYFFTYFEYNTILLRLVRGLDSGACTGESYPFPPLNLQGGRGSNPLTHLVSALDKQGLKNIFNRGKS